MMLVMKSFTGVFCSGRPRSKSGLSVDGVGFLFSWIFDSTLWCGLLGDQLCQEIRRAILNVKVLAGSCTPFGNAAACHSLAGVTCLSHLFKGVAGCTPAVPVCIYAKIKYNDVLRLRKTRSI